jgi:hypothetical protein
MSLRFKYRHLVTPQPIPSLGGLLARPRPIVTVTLIGPSNSAVERALLDTGADDTVFPERVAGLLGVDLTNAPMRTLTGIAGTGHQVRYALIRLRLTDGAESRDWPAWVGFTNAPLRYPALGFAGCLQFFTASFHGDLEEVELAVNRLYRGV